MTGELKRNLKTRSWKLLMLECNESSLEI